MVHTSCFEDVAVGPANMLAVTSSQDFTKKPGLYLYQEINALDVFPPPVYAPVPNAR